MKNRSHGCIRVFVLLAILQSSICHAKLVNDTRRTKREISAAERTPRSKGETGYARPINLEREEERDDDPKEGNTYRDDAKGKHEVSRKATDSMISVDLHPANAEESLDRDGVSSYPNSRRSSEEPEEADEGKATGRDENEAASNLVRLPRDLSGDLDRYTDQDERSSLYDDYEAKDVAKRGVLNSEDYEEIEEDSPGIPEDTAAVRESANEAEKRETRRDDRVKRDQAEISETLDIYKTSPDDPAKLEEPKKSPYSREVSRVELSKGLDEASASKNKESRLSESPSKVQEPTNEVISSKRDGSSAEYQRRVEEEIQRKIDSLREEIQRDVEARRRVRDIENNNARFDELRDQELEDEKKRNFKDEPIEKRQTVAKRSIREIADGTAASFRTNEKKRSLKKEQTRSRKSDKSDTLKENENLKRRFVADYDKSPEQIPSKGLFKKKRERVRQIFLTNNDQRQAKKRQSRSYTLPSDRTAIGPEDELFTNADSYLHTDNRMLQASRLPIDDEDENNEGEQKSMAKHSDSLVSLTGSSQELSPRLEKEYKEAFGGLPSEPGNALARFKRIKRVLAGSDAKI